MLQGTLTIISLNLNLNTELVRYSDHNCSWKIGSNDISGNWLSGNQIVTVLLKYASSSRSAGSTWSSTRVTVWRTTTVNSPRSSTHTTPPTTGCCWQARPCRTSCQSCGPFSISCCPPSLRLATPLSSGSTRPLLSLEKRYCDHLTTKHPNTGFIWILNLFSIQMVPNSWFIKWPDIQAMSCIPVFSVKLICSKNWIFC